MTVSTFGNRYRNQEELSRRLISLYIHIPFCEVKCGYCDFFSVPRGHGDFELQRLYVDALLSEIEARSPEFSGREVRSIFFGGGTPSLLDPGLLERIFSTLGRHFSWQPQTEITLESNPKTVSREKFRDFRSLGVNRLSIGVQSFQEKFLKVLGRIHSGGEARRTVTDAREAGFQNINIDLIYALPGQTFQDWQGDLEEALLLETPHLSAYHLTIEKGTPFDSLYKSGGLPAEEEGIRCLTWTRERLCQARREPYEISNFSQPGFESIHNRNYWHYGEYLGFGTAAASFTFNPPLHVRGGQGGDIGKRRINCRDLKKYLAGRWDGFSESISLATAMGEFCMLALRTREGIRREAFHHEFGRNFEKLFEKEIDRLTRRGWFRNTKDGWELAPEGILFADEAALAFL